MRPLTAIILSVSVTALCAGAAAYLLRRPASPPVAAGSDNVTVADGTQTIQISAKGGYSPQVTLARANLPTVLKVTTKGTFDCSSALTVPSLGLNKDLPPTGETLIQLPPQKPGSTFKGLCAMGMYNFQIMFN